MKLETVANITIALLFSAVAGILGLVLYYSGLSGFPAIAGALVFTAILGLAQWYLAPPIIRLISGCRELSREQAPRIFEAVSRLSKKAGLPKPPKIYLAAGAPNAFSFGRSRADANVAVTAGLLKALSPEEVEAVLAHEIAHIRHRDVVIMTVASMIPVLLYYAAIIFLSGRSDRENRHNPFAIYAGGFLARIFGQLLVLWLSRRREYAADEFAARAAGGAHLARGLVKISYGLGAGGNSSLSCLYIGDRTPEDSRALAGYLDIDAKSLEKAIKKEQSFGLLELFMTHPLTSKRILALKRMEAR